MTASESTTPVADVTIISIRDVNAEWWARWSEHCVKVGSHYETRTVDGNDYIVLVPNVPFREKA